MLARTKCLGASIPEGSGQLDQLQLNACRSRQPPYYYTGARPGLKSLLSIFGTAIALILYNRMAQRVGVLFASTVTYLIPVVAVIWGLTAGESIGLQHIAAMLVILTGVYLVKK